MGSIYKRGSIYWIKYYRNGKPYRESTESTKFTDAKRHLKKREGEIAEGKLPFYFDKVTFEELCEDLLVDYEVNGKKSLRRLKYHITQLERFFDGDKAVNITTPRIRKYTKVRLDEGAAPATVTRELAMLKRMFRLGAEAYPPRVDRVPFIPMPNVNNVRKGFLEYADFLRLRENLPEYLQPFVTFSYRSAWRRAEVINLTWSQIDLKQRIARIEVGETKNKEARELWLDDELLETLTGLREEQKRSGRVLPYVFLNKDGTGQIKNFQRAWKTALKNAKLNPNLLLYDFRRSAVRNMVRSGVPERVAMSVSGHRTRSVFDRYNITSDEDLRLAAKRQQEYLEKQATGTVTGTIHSLETKKHNQTSQLSLQAVRMNCAPYVSKRDNPAAYRILGPAFNVKRHPISKA